MDHFREVTGTGGADVRVAFGRRERQENRLAVRHLLVVAADHQAVAFFEAPDAAARPRVDQRNALGFTVGVQPQPIFIVAVAAVDDDPALAHQIGELMDGLVRRCTRGYHYPRDLRRFGELGDHVAEAVGALRAERRDAGDRFRISIEGYDLMAARD